MDTQYATPKLRHKNIELIVSVVFYGLFNDVASNLRIYSIKWKVDERITNCEGYERK